jgi:hypothetical protein
MRPTGFSLGMLSTLGYRARQLDLRAIKQFKLKTIAAQCKK